ncbi:maleylpyruvate isomerase family mycothiol-dependent enzyme [soil metagenome]
MTPHEAADAADALWQRIQDQVDALSTEDWARPCAPCPGWDVHDLVSHIAGLTTMFAGLPQPVAPEDWQAPADLNPIDTMTETGVAARRGRSPEQQRQELAEARFAHVEGVRQLADMEGETVGPTGPSTQAAFFRVRMFDLWHHLWDLRDAVGATQALEDDSTAAIECHRYVADLAPWLYGRKARAPEGAAVRLQLGAPLDLDRSVAVTEGRARFTDELAEDVVRGPAALFTLVMTGRVAPEDADGLLADGDEAQRLLGARLFG